MLLLQAGRCAALAPPSCHTTTEGRVISQPKAGTTASAASGLLSGILAYNAVLRRCCAAALLRCCAAALLRKSRLTVIYLPPALLPGEGNAPQ
jgi:hypothetical protein